MRLDQYTLSTYTPGAPYWKQLLWYFIGSPLVETPWLPISTIKVQILRCFGSQIGRGVRIKTSVRIKFPWRLNIGDYVWVGENVWIDNLAIVTIESHVCLSQGVYLCTGNHDWKHPDFKLLTAPILIEEGCWLAAQCRVAPGVTVGKGAVLSLGSVANQSLKPMMIYAGNPAQPIKAR
jgi:putative colanic acid biosynthesis acetyltransferase WcaF